MEISQLLGIIFGWHRGIVLKAREKFNNWYSVLNLVNTGSVRVVVPVSEHWFRLVSAIGELN